MITLVRHAKPGAATATPIPRASRPLARVQEGGLSVEGRLVAGFELAPLNLELMAEVEREAALESLAAFYDAISRPFQLLSVPAQRDPEEHLAAIDSGSKGSGTSEHSPPMAPCTAKSRRPRGVPPSTDLPAARCGERARAPPGPDEPDPGC